jgi:hypothetical protein
MSPPSSGWKKRSKEHVTSSFRLEEEAKQETSMKKVVSNSHIFLRNVGWLLMGYTRLYPRRKNSLLFVTDILRHLDLETFWKEY